jgi:hypothetical protein
MKDYLALIGAALGLAVGLHAGSITYTWNFDTPAGLLGTSQTYTSTNNGGAPNITITAYGLGRCTMGGTMTSPTASGCSATYLYGKNGGGAEQGLGIYTDPTGDNEIYQGAFVQLNLTNLFLDISPAYGSITLGSVQANEYFTFWMNSTQGQPGSFLYRGTGSGNPATVTLGANNPGVDLGSDMFFSVGAQQGNVLLSTISATVPDPPINVNAPEPASFVLAGLALAGAGVFGRRRKAQGKL